MSWAGSKRAFLIVLHHASEVSADSPLRQGLSTALGQSGLATNSPLHSIALEGSTPHPG